MKKIKNSLLILLILANTASYAQNKKPKKTLEQKSVGMTTKLHKEVKLTKAQSKEITAINLAYLKEKEILDAKLKAIKKNRNKKINVILTDEQKKKKEELKKKKKK